MSNKSSGSCLGSLIMIALFALGLWIMISLFIDSFKPKAPEASTVSVETTVSTESSVEYSEVEGYTIKKVNGLIYVHKETNVRRLPDLSGEKVGSIDGNKYIVVNGVCEETGWYRITYEGEEMYMSNLYTSKVEMQE